MTDTAAGRHLPPLRREVRSTSPSPSLVGRVRDAVERTIEERRAIIEAFFGQGPAAARHLGVGRAIADFTEWEIASGRIASHGGSPWWAATNGLLLADLEHASVALHGDLATGATSAAWAELALGFGNPQRTFWVAHQRSLSRAVELASPLLAHEPAAERSFIVLALAVVDAAAAAGIPTDTALLGTLTARRYPDRYPASAADVVALRSTLEELSPTIGPTRRRPPDPIAGRPAKSLYR